MRELRLNDLGEYQRRLCQSESELQALIEEGVVAESWFFRDERPFQWLRESFCMRWVNSPVLPALRVLSLACAGGEEPYSIAMLLLDLGLPSCRFQIDAVDVSKMRLMKARRAVYSANAFRGSDLDYQKRFFHEHPNGYELTSTVRATVRFIEGSVLDPQLLAGSAPYDVLFCRNLLIYLSAPARDRLLAAIDRLLAPEGVLLIGHADRLDWAATAPRFTPVGNSGCFAYRRAARTEAGPIQSHRDPPPPLPLWSGPSLVSAPGAAQPADSPALVPRTVDLMVHSLLDRAAELANLGRFQEAAAVCERHIQQKSPTAPAYYLLGMIHQAAGQRVKAEDCFKKTLYLDPRHDEALLALALLAERRGDHEMAASFRRRAERIAMLTVERTD